MVKTDSGSVGMQGQGGDDGAEQRRLNYDERERLRAEYTPLIEKALKKAGLRLKIGGCGCCGSPWVELPDGTDFEDLEVNTLS